jgi:hypothetical protein
MAATGSNIYAAEGSLYQLNIYVKATNSDDYIHTSHSSPYITLTADLVGHETNTNALSRRTPS